MKKYITLLAFFIVSIVVIKAQKIEVSDGTLMGLNYSSY